MKKLNPNIEAPEPRVIQIKKVAIYIDEYNDLRLND